MAINEIFSNKRLYRTKSCRYEKKEADLQCNSHSPLFDFLTLNLLLVPFFAIVLWFSGSSGSHGSLVLLVLLVLVALVALVVLLVLVVLVVLVVLWFTWFSYMVPVVL